MFNEGTNPQSNKGRDGNWSVYSAGSDVVFNLDLNVKDTWYTRTLEHIKDNMVVARATAVLSDLRSSHELAAALQAYVKAKGSFPRGTLPRPRDPDRFSDWPPDQRLSWLADVLPFVGDGEYADMHPKADKFWADGANIEFARLPVPQFLSPPRAGGSAARMVTYAGEPGVFAPTHYVGVAGVGMEAASYTDTDPATSAKRGVFGYDRVTRPADIKDGPANTIAVLLVPTDQAGPWIAGGGSTVRGVPVDADGVRPFVCTEYKGRKGTFAIMADFKVRFIPASIPADVFRALCTVAGNEKIGNLDKVAPVVEVEAPPPVTAEASPANNTAPADKASAADLAKLQGTWKLVGGEAGGGRLPVELIGEQRFTIRGNKMTSAVAGKVEETEEFTLDASKSPKGIQLTGKDGKGIGVYELSDNEFKFCVVEAKSGRRPTSLHTTPGSKENLFILQRVKP
jgi:uncharacterized protein (TIGR03067 family)